LITTHAAQSLLLLWRGRMIAQFEAEGRGTTWVLNGQLQRRQNSQLYSPNYPVAPVYVGAPVNLQDCQVCGCIARCNHNSPQSPVPFFQAWDLNVTSSQLKLCNSVTVPVGVSKLALPDAAYQTRFLSACAINETLCAMSASLLPGALVTMQECVAGPSHVMLTDWAYDDVGSEQQAFVYDSTSSFIVQPASGLCLVCLLATIMTSLNC
jgi:hypothetical protein